jgi:aminoglycoside phosphotransferase (APT) family kinase protein
MSDEGFLLTTDNAREYLTSHGLLRGGDDVTIRELGGGVSNIVLMIEWPGEPGRGWVIKQSLGKLRVKDDWRSERSRILREAEAITVLGPVLGHSAVPEVVHLDAENFLFVMTAAPRGSRTWKDLLLGRRADVEVARDAALLLAKMINASIAAPSLGEPFEDQKVFDQLRIDPYYRTTALRHPELKRQFEDLIAATLEIRTSLVHGDYSPKNMLVRGKSIFLIDFEVVHWGDPAFDAAFLLNHLFLKAFHLPLASAEFFELATEFWRVLIPALGPLEAPRVQRMTLWHLGALMLARIDGKSPAEYIQDEKTKQKVRGAATRILRERPNALSGVVEIVKYAMSGSDAK